jgi:hypothetical protein
VPGGTKCDPQSNANCLAGIRDMEAKTVISGSSSIGASVAIEPGARQPLASDGIAIFCYENEVPPFVEAELERLYGNIFSSLAHFRAFSGLPADTSTYVVRKNNEIVTIFLFSSRKGHVQVLNEGMQLDEKEISRFADTIFAAYKSVNVISFHAVPAKIRKLSYPYQYFTCTEDLVVTLPDSREAYLASLGKNTRRNIKRYMDKLMRDHPSFRYDFYERDAADEQQMRIIIGFSRARIAGKDKAFAIDENEIAQIIRLVKARGLIGVATIDGRVCGGGIGYLVGSSFFFRIISHDPEYNDYSTGILCCYLTICESIARGCKQFNFMQDGYDYKYALGAVARKLEHVAIYRSRMQLLLNGGMALKLAAQGYMRKVRVRMLDAAGKKDKPASKLVSGLLWFPRKLKRIGLSGKWMK